MGIPPEISQTIVEKLDLPLKKQLSRRPSLLRLAGVQIVEDAPFPPPNIDPPPIPEQYSLKNDPPGEKTPLLDIESQITDKPRIHMIQWDPLIQKIKGRGLRK